MHNIPVCTLSLKVSSKNYRTCKCEYSWYSILIYRRVSGVKCVQLNEYSIPYVSINSKIGYVIQMFKALNVQILSRIY